MLAGDEPEVSLRKLQKELPVQWEKQTERLRTK